jgi:hypothetical protein
MAKRFFYVAMGILALAAAYHLGATRTGAQSGGAFAGISVDSLGHSTTAITSAGDVYARDGNPVCDHVLGAVVWGSDDGSCSGWTYMGNVLTGDPVSAQGDTFGAIKGAFRR